MRSDLVYDVGMNNGDDTAHYLRRGFSVVAIEADPAFVAAAAHRFAPEIAAGRLTLVSAAVGRERGEATFYFSEGNRGVWNSFSPAIAGRDGVPTRAVTVECVPFGDVLAQYGVPYYLKIDIEGADHICLEALSADDLPQYVSFEASEGKLADLFTLYRLGYRKFRLIDQLRDWTPVTPPALHSLDHARQSLVRHVRRGVRAMPVAGSLVRRLQSLTPARDAHRHTGTDERVHAVSSSGPMPDERGGPWYSVDDVAYAWQYVATLPGARAWHDIHAARD